VKAQEFVQFLRKVVQEEIKRQVPGLVKEVLAEQLVRRIVTEQLGQVPRPQRQPVVEQRRPVPAQPRSLRELTGVDSRDFEDSFGSQKDEAVSYSDVRPPANPIFEGTRALPISAKELMGEGGNAVTEAPSVTNVDLDVLGQTGIFDYDRMRMIMEESTSRPNSRSILPPSAPKKSEAELARYRESLEKMPVDSSWQK
jgi:hypothetical protein